jgi:hypothetical protein
MKTRRSPSRWSVSNDFFSKAERFLLRLAILILLVIALGRLIIGELYR